MAKEEEGKREGTQGILLQALQMRRIQLSGREEGQIGGQRVVLVPRRWPRKRRRKEGF